MSVQIRSFKELLNNVGIILQNDENPNILKKEQSLVIRDLINEFEEFPKSVPSFVAGIKQLTKKEKLFKKALLPSNLIQISADNEIITKQESIFRLFLNVDVIQKEIISLLLEDITQRCIEEDDDNGIWIQLLLNPLRYLSFIKDPKALTTHLLDVLEIAAYPVKLELLKYLPDIIPPSNHDEISAKLIIILNSDLTCAVIDCLNHLYLSADSKDTIFDHILIVLNETQSLKTVCLIFYFLISNSKPENLQNILLKTRNALNSILEITTNKKDVESEQVLTFNEIRTITISSKNVSECWINLLNKIRSVHDHNPIDILILLMLHSTDGNRKHTVKTIIKRKAKTGQFNTALIGNTIEKFLAPQILKDFIESIIEIAGFLLRGTPECVEIAKTLYLTTFSHKYTHKPHRQQIIHSLIILTGCCDNTLNILQAIVEKHMKLLQSHTIQLMTLLDRIEKLDLGRVKQVYELLCALIYCPNENESMEGYQNTIHIVIQKQLSSKTKNIKYSGIIGAVAVAKNLVLNQEEQDSNISSECSSISDIPDGPVKEATKLLDQTSNFISSCAITQGLFYDQLAQMLITTENIDKYFLSWIDETISKNFEENYICNDTPSPINDISFSVKYNINTEDEIDVPVAVKIGDLTVTGKDNLILVIAPFFRLLRLIQHRKYDGNLSQIDALLGCGVILPEMDPDLELDSFDSVQAKQVVDCLFHCINWFREVINAFISQKKLRRKLLQRLSDLIELENLFGRCMKSLPDHKLPQSNFYSLNLDKTNNSILDRSKSLVDKGKKRPYPFGNTSRLSETTQISSKISRRTQIKDKEPKTFFFREMDTDFMLLLKYPIITSNDDDSIHLTMTQFKFILKDIVVKLNAIKKPQSSSTFNHMKIIKSSDFITDCVRFMPHMNKHLIKLITEIKDLLKRSDEILDSNEMFYDISIELKQCFNLTLEMKLLVLELCHNDLSLFREFLRAFVDEKSNQVITTQTLILQYMQSILPLVDYSLTLSSAVHLINIMKILVNLSTDSIPKKKLINISGKLLSRQWYNTQGIPEFGATANLHYNTLVKAHLNGINMEMISNLVSWIHEETQNLKSKDDTLRTFPSISKKNYPILFKGICEALLEFLQNQLNGFTNTEHLEIWFNAVTTMKYLMDIVKMLETKANLSVFLKKSIAILKVFLSQGLPIVEIMFRSEADKCIQILKSLQQSTRFIHHLCCHSKITKDNTLISYIPQMRLVLEKVIYRVKAALVANNCSAAFWMGTLKNKNIHGEDIISQSSNNSTQQEDDDEDALPPDEDESDEESIQSIRNETETSDII